MLNFFKSYWEAIVTYTVFFSLLIWAWTITDVWAALGVVILMYLWMWISLALSFVAAIRWEHKKMLLLFVPVWSLVIYVALSMLF